MPLHGKIVVVKRSGGDGTEFPLTASCLFGRKPDCDIRIQLPQVSKEHCRIDLNENKEVILTNLSSVNPTRVNGEVLQQSERLKDGDVITIVDRSFRFEYPPAPTPKKFIKGSKAGTPKSHLKDGTNHNIQRSLEQTKGKDPKEDGDTQQSNTVSPFSDLYQMIRKSLDVRTPQKSTGTNIRTPSRKINVSTKGTPKVAEATVSHGEAEAEAKGTSNVVPTSDKKRSNSPQIIPSDVMTPAKNAANKSEASSPQTRQRVTPQRFNASDDVERICTPTLKSPVRRRSTESTPAKQDDKVMSSPHNKNSPGVIKKGVANKRKSAELALDSPAPHMKKKCVSFGGYLVPELFDKKMPPDSPLRKGENPRRSLCLVKPKQSLLRRASVIGLLNVAESPTKKSSRSPNVSVRNSPKGRSPSSKEPSPGKKTPKPRTPSPHKKSPKSTPAKSPRPNTPSAKASLSGQKSSKSRSSSDKTSPRTPLPKSAKSTPTSPKWPTPVIKSLKPNTPSAIVSMSRKKSPKSRSSPESSENTSRTPLPKSPKSTPASPKWVCLTMKSPKLNTQSAKASLSGEKSPKWRSSYPASSEKTSKLSTPRRTSSSSNKLETPLTIGPTCKETPTSTKRTSPRLTTQGNGNKTPVKAPQGTQMNISSVQGRFSVSRIETPTPMAEAAIVDPVQSATVIPKIPLKRKLMKSASRKTPLAKSAIKVMIRRSGISRASMKAMSSWADTVRFGQVKVQAAVPAKKTVKSIVTTTKAVKKKVSRPQTPLRKQLGHASTGHADSPVTIVVGRAFTQKVSHPTGAAPKVIFNTVISKKNMKMDEDLSGISEMFRTPLKEVARKLETNSSSTTKTPLLVNEPAVLEPSVLNTPEEPGEMVVSPLTLASTAKAGRYNKEAVKRLLNGSQESSFNNLSSGMEIKDDSVEQQYTGMKASDVTTPKQKPQPSVCLTGVRRLMKTPRQKAEPVEDIRGKLLKTPKQKPEQQECLTGVKRIMRTPRQKIEPVEDLSGKRLKTPKQKSEEKNIFTTPTASEHINLQRKLLQTPKEAEDADVSFSGIADLLETPAKDSHNLVTPAKESQDLPEQTNSATPKVSNSPIDCFAGIKKVMKTPKQRSAPFEGILGIERLMKTPKVRSEPVEDNFGPKQLMKSPRLRGSAPLEDFEGLQELIKEPVEFKDHPASSYLDEEKDFIQGQPEDKVSSGVTHDTPQLDISREKTEVLVEVPSVACESLEAKKAVSQAVSEAAPGVTEMHTASIESANSKKSVQGRRAKIAEPKVAEPVTTESSEGPVVTALVRGRRGKKVDPTEPPAEEAIVAPKTKRGRFAKKVETVQQAAPETLPEPENEQSLPVDIEPVLKNSVAPLENEAVKPKRGRYAKKALEQIDTFLDAATETLMEPDSEPTLPENIEPPISDSVALLEKVAVRPKRGRCAKKPSEQIETIAEAATETLPEPKGEQTLPVDIEPAMNKSVAPLERESVQPKRGRYAKKVETVEQAATETLPEPESEQSLPVDIEPVMKKSVAPLENEAVKPKRGRYAKKALDQIETFLEAATETLMEPDSEPTLPENIEPPISDSVALLEKVAVRPKRGRCAKKASEQIETIAEAATETLPEPKGEQTLPVDIEPAMNKSVAPLERESVKPKRGRYAKKVETVEQAATETLPEPESRQSLPVDIEPAMNNSVAPLEKEAVKSKRGRYAKKALEQIETIPVAATLLELDIEPAVTDNVAPLEEAVKPKRGRKPKQFSHCKQAQSSACSDVSQDNTQQDNSEGSGDRQGQMPSEHHENKSSDSAKSLPEFKTATERDITVVQKSSLRGRRGKLVENTAEEEKQDTGFEEALVSAPVRARRGKRIEATATPAGRQTTRNRNAKTKKDACDAQSVMVPEKDMELNLVTGTSETHTSQDDVRMSDEDLVNKSTRGRRAKHTPVEPPQPKLEKTLEIEQPSVSVQPQLPAPTNKKGRGRKVISETVELEEHEKDEIISEEIKHQSKPLARTRGRNAKHKEELDNSDKTSIVAQSVLQEIIKTSGEQTVDVENPVQVQAEAPQFSEPEQMSEHASSSTKTRRGVVQKLKQEAVTPRSAENQDSPIETPTEKPKRGRQAKQVEDGTTSEETDIATRRVVRKPKQEVTVESVENHDCPIGTLTEKPKRGRRAKQVEDVTTSEVKEKPEPQQKPQRGRGLKTNLKNEMPQVVPAKRARRGLAFACDGGQRRSSSVSHSTGVSYSFIRTSQKGKTTKTCKISEVEPRGRSS
ncbi:proliferation marker protein Ki-67 [Phycodurus eques]|uniref:proliferation marker protein Ki-67 n=1 Tax=Phycodurus eques TaxID=693459 RepID=UPI002ACE293E|nr:proliferation marker protein Ki-67 [Phycodurus eques]